MNNNPAQTKPIIPIVEDNIRNITLHILKAFIISGSVNMSPVIDVIAITITAIGDTSPALTAASPKTNAPTILIEVPIWLGKRISLSLSISNVIIRIKIEKALGNGTFNLCVINDKRRVSGNISWLKVVIAIYKAGVVIVIIKAINLNNLVKEGLLTSVPVCPKGGFYAWNNKLCILFLKIFIIFQK